MVLIQYRSSYTDYAPYVLGDFNIGLLKKSVSALALIFTNLIQIYALLFVRRRAFLYYLSNTYCPWLDERHKLQTFWKYTELYN